MARFNREDSRTVLPQLEKEIETLEKGLDALSPVALSGSYNDLTDVPHTMANDQISIQNQDIDVTVAASSYTQTLVTVNCKSVAKYSARCVVGFNIFNQDNGGANSSLVFPYKLYVNQTDQTVNLTLRNTATSAAVVTVRVFMLYTRNSE